MEVYTSYNVQPIYPTQLIKKIGETGLKLSSYNGDILDISKEGLAYSRNKRIEELKKKINEGRYEITGAAMEKIVLSLLNIAQG